MAKRTSDIEIHVIKQKFACPVEGVEEIKDRHLLMVGEVVRNDQHLAELMQIPCRTVNNCLQVTEQSYQALVTLYRELQEEYKKVLRSNVNAVLKCRELEEKIADMEMDQSLIALDDSTLDVERDDPPEKKKQ